MQQRHKQRLVGAVVIVSLAVIFLPMLLRGPVEQRRFDVPAEMPPRPEARTTTRPAPVPGEPPPPVLERIPVRAPDSEETTPAEAEVPAVPEVPDPVPAEEAPTGAQSDNRGYAVQVGSFRNRDNAVALRDRLREAGYPAYVEESRAGESATVFRLRVGPTSDREESRALAARLADEENLEGIVVSNP